jgi:hypothetical protein
MIRMEDFSYSNEQWNDIRVVIRDALGEASISKTHRPLERIEIAVNQNQVGISCRVVGVQMRNKCRPQVDCSRTDRHHTLVVGGDGTADDARAEIDEIGRSVHDNDRGWSGPIRVGSRGSGPQHHDLGRRDGLWTVNLSVCRGDGHVFSLDRWSPMVQSSWTLVVWTTFFHLAAAVLSQFSAATREMGTRSRSASNGSLV